MNKIKGISILVIVFILGFILAGCQEGVELGENEVKVKASASSLVGSHYEDVVEQLEVWGFTNVKTEPVYDIVWGFTKEGTTKSVKIGGSDTFKSGDIYNKNVSILVTYSMKDSADPTKQKHSITWQYEDGTVIKTEDISWGVLPSYTGDTLVKASTNEFTYTFSHWTPELESVTENKSYIAVFIETQKDISKVEVRNSESSFVGTNYQEVIETLENWGFTNIITVPVYDIIFNITQPRSTKDVKIAGIDNYKNGDIFDKDIEIIVTYSMRVDDAPKYIITWEINGVIVETDNNVKEGSIPYYNGTTPIKDDALYNYTFMGWAPAISSVTQNQNYVAIFEQGSLKEYTITWKDANNSMLGTTSVPYGSLPSYNIPVDTAQWHYIDWTPSITEATANATYTANGELMEYEIAWIDYDETFLGTTIVSYGSTPSNDLPNDTADRYYIGWSPELASVTGTATYTAITVNFPREFAFRAAVVAFTNYYADDKFMEDDNTYDMSKLHSYDDINGFFLYIDDEGSCTVKDNNTWHVNHIQMTVPAFHTKIDASLDVSFDGQYYIVSNLSGEAPSYSDYDSRYSSMRVLENDSWFVIASQISVDMISMDRNIQPKYRPTYIDNNGEHAFLTLLIMESILYRNTYNEVSTEWLPVIYSNIELLRQVINENLSVGDFVIKIEFTCRNGNNDIIYAVAYGIEYYNGEVILVRMDQVSY